MLGTVGLNAYDCRPLTRNLLGNSAYSVVGAVATVGANAGLTSGLGSARPTDLLDPYLDFGKREFHRTYASADQHIEAFGLPLRYYVDSLRVFRFVQGRDSFWRKHVLETDDVDTQWGKMMHRLGVDVAYALSAQAKGKVERPYRWLQHRIIRTCALEGIASLDEARIVLRDELDRYNHHQVHSTTREIPALRFAQAVAAGNTLFRPFSLPEPYTSPDDVFCLREGRTINPYGRISLFGHDIRVANVPLREKVEVHLVPDQEKNTMDIRIWWQGKLAHSLALPLRGFRVHL